MGTAGAWPLREQGKLPEYCNPHAEYLIGDVRDRALLERAVDGIDVVFHGAAILLGVVPNRPEQVRKLIVASSTSLE